ncbi:MAG: hypothetical protein LIR50_19270 [Bacillota bacterium]|nr:hypothetical protein [Bacillota bacterium]
MNKLELISSLQRGDIVNIKCGNDWNTTATVMNIFDLVIEFKDSSGLFDFTKKYLLNSNLELEKIEC